MSGMAVTLSTTNALTENCLIVEEANENFPYK